METNLIIRDENGMGSLEIGYPRENGQVCFTCQYHDTQHVTPKALPEIIGYLQKAYEEYQQSQHA